MSYFIEKQLKRDREGLKSLDAKLQSRLEEIEQFKNRLQEIREKIDAYFTNDIPFSDDIVKIKSGLVCTVDKYDTCFGEDLYLTM